MTDETKNSLMLVLCKGTTGSRVSVDLESFLLFNSQMDHDLKQLVERWSDFATPGSISLDARRRQFE